MLRLEAVVTHKFWKDMVPMGKVCSPGDPDSMPWVLTLRAPSLSDSGQDPTSGSEHSRVGISGFCLSAFFLSSALICF